MQNLPLSKLNMQIYRLFSFWGKIIVGYQKSNVDFEQIDN
jgi:hypothetical protein